MPLFRPRFTSSPLSRRPVPRGFFLLAILGVFACLGWGTRPGVRLRRWLRLPNADAGALQPAPESPPAVKGQIEPRRFVELGVLQPGRVESLAVKKATGSSRAACCCAWIATIATPPPWRPPSCRSCSPARRWMTCSAPAAVSLADATLALKQAEKAQALAADQLASLQRSKSQSRIDQAKANLLLAEKRLAKDRDDLAKAQRLYNKRRDIIWKFVSRHEFELLLTMMKKKVAYSERRAEDAKKKTEDLLKPLDEIDLALARSALALADARLHQAGQERMKWLEGPDPDLLAVASARLEAAEAGLAAAQAALQNSQIVSPISGTLVDLNVKQGEAAIPGQTLAVVADLSDWVVETQDLGEEDVVRLQPGERFSLSLDAYPDVALDGVVKSIRQYYTEEEGDVFYHAKIGLQPVDMPLLWGMTARIVP